jgi:potassium-dependent mechanosensitive channel
MHTKSHVACNSTRAKMDLSNKNQNSKRPFVPPLTNAVVTILLLLTCEFSFSQNDSTLHRAYDSAQIRYDSARNKTFYRIKQFGDSERRKNLREYIEDTIATKQDETIQLIKSLMLEAQNYIESGVDTTGLAQELRQIENWFDITSDGVFINTGTIQTHRNLETSYKIMRELLIRVSARKSSLDDYYKNLVRFRNTIDSLYKEDVLYSFSSDSAVLMRYAQRLTVVLQQIKPIDSSLKKTLIITSELQPTVNFLVNKLNLSLDQIEAFQKELSASTFHRETSNLGGPVGYVRRFDEIINFSMRKAELSLAFYTRNEIGKITLLVVLIILCTLFLVRLKRNMQRQSMVGKSNVEQAVLKYPFLSALVIVLNIFQFIFIDPPFAFAGLIWILSGISLIFILRNVIARYWMFALCAMFILFLLTCFDDLILQASRPERWMMVALSIAGILSGSIVIITGPRTQLKEKLFLYFIGFVVILQIASIVTNTYGRYNLSKTCLTAGFFNLILAILFFWTLRFINQGLAMAARLYSKPGKKLFNINFERVGGKAPTIFYVVLFVGWFVLFARNFYASKFISVPLKDFIVQKRTIGEFSFTIVSVLECFLILYLSATISRMVSFFASQHPSEQLSHSRRGGIGSWGLIIRISVITVGLLAAFAALGIPMDRLTIILSALSVGIGFGLQSLVNNLVSGLIISFEKPVNIGDFVEIGGQSGTVKSIGFRSSIIATPAGANLVIPNGNLLNQHLVNWTRDDHSRLVDVPVGVALGTDLERAIAVLKELPAKDERILSSPAPAVVITQFSNGSIDMRLSFWVRNLSDWIAVKSDMLLAIDHAFKENSIKTPLPQYMPFNAALTDARSK